VAHSHVGEGHVAVVGMEVWRRAGMVENGWSNVVRRASRMHGAGARERRANVKDMMRCGESGRGKLGSLYRKPFRSQDDVGFGHNGARSKDIVYEILKYKPCLQEVYFLSGECWVSDSRCYVFVIAVRVSSIIEYPFIAHLPHLSTSDGTARIRSMHYDSVGD
jgi:hypothetical protein